MNLETLEYFKYIATYKNITRAAKHFHVSQSTLSRQIMALENEIGASLLIRNNKKIELTEAGKAFYNNCELLIKHMNTVIRNTQAVDNGSSGTLTITSPGHLFETLPDSLEEIKNIYPSINLIVESYNFNEIPSSIQYGVYDIGFTYDFAVPPYEDLECIPIGIDDFSLAIPSKLFEAPSQDSIPKLVKSLPLILPSHIEPPFLKLIMHELQALSGVKHLNPTYVNTSDSAMLQISMGLGYSIIPTCLTKSKFTNENVSYIELTNFSAKGTIVMLYNKKNDSELVNSFIDIIKKSRKMDSLTALA